MKESSSIKLNMWKIYLKNLALIDKKHSNGLSDQAQQAWIGKKVDMKHTEV